jgi:hypothetical protein
MLDGNDHEEDCRLFACDLIQNAGILLRLPQVALTTAQMLLQRVYHAPDYTFDKYCLDITSMAALFLGAKIEEYPRNVRSVIDVFTHVIAKKLNRNIVLSYSQHEKVREELITAERRLLKTLGFNLLSDYPHKIVVNYYHAIAHALDPEGNLWNERDKLRLIQIAWNYCNDSLRLDIFIKYSKVVVACACIQMACEDTGMLLPKSTEGLNWFNLFVSNEHEVLEAIRIIKKLYHRKQVDPSGMERHIYLANMAH